MIVDTSALVAIIKKEPGFQELVTCIASAGAALISAASYVELFAVSGREASSATDLRSLLSDLRIEIEAFDEAQAKASVSAYQRYGRGSGHPAKLNMGDVYSYALARVRDEPLLFVGDDFARTDASPVLPRAV